MTYASQLWEHIGERGGGPKDHHPFPPSLLLGKVPRHPERARVAREAKDLLAEKG